MPVASDVSADESEVSERVLRALHPAGFLRDHACNSAPQFVPAQSVPSEFYVHPPDVVPAQSVPI